MDNRPPQILDEVFSNLIEVEESILTVIKNNTAQGAVFYDVTLVLWGAANRTISQCRGFLSMVRDKNFTCSSAILRMQLDTVLRLYAGLRFGHISDFSSKLMDGERVSNLKSVDGKRLFDSYLVKELSKQCHGFRRFTTEALGQFTFQVGMSI